MLNNILKTSFFFLVLCESSSDADVFPALSLFVIRSKWGALSERAALLSVAKRYRSHLHDIAKARAIVKKIHMTQLFRKLTITAHQRYHNSDLFQLRDSYKYHSDSNEVWLRKKTSLCNQFFVTGG